MSARDTSLKVVVDVGIIMIIIIIIVIIIMNVGRVRCSDVRSAGFPAILLLPSSHVRTFPSFYEI